MAADLVAGLRQLVQRYDSGAQCAPTQDPCVTCCMVCAPPIMAPTAPQPVKPLQLPCAAPSSQQPLMSEEEAEKTRYSNFYNNYNVDWHAEASGGVGEDPRRGRCNGVTTDGKSPCCSKKPPPPIEDKGCPTGFKPCAMRLTPPPGCHPCGVWGAQIQPCPPKAKKKRAQYQPGECVRPCCKHWAPKEDACKYDDPCRAQCVNHPPGIKPKKRASVAAC